MGIKTVTHATLGNVVILAFLVGKIKITKLLARRKGSKSPRRSHPGSLGAWVPRWLASCGGGSEKACVVSDVAGYGVMQAI